MIFRTLSAGVVLAALVAAQSTPGTEGAPAARTIKDVRDTPRGALLGFLEACRADDFRRAASFLDIRREHRRAGTPEQLASSFKQILDQRLSKDPAAISNATEGDLTDGLEPNLELLGVVRQDGRDVDLLLERVIRPEVGEIWLISNATVSLIPALHVGVATNPIEKYLPDWLLRDGAFDTQLWQWFALVLLTLFALLFGHFLAKLVLRSFRPLVRRTQSDLDDHLIDSVRRPMQFLIALAAYRAGVAWIAPSYLLRTYIGRMLTGVIYLALAWVCMRLIDVVTTKLVAAMSGRQKTSAASVMPLARRTLKAFAVVFAILATLGSWGYDTTALLAGLGVGGVAVALAAQKTIENLFGGVAITSDKPILVGDFCRYGDKVGTVEDIGLRSTRIRTLDRTVVTIPNADFSSLQIENFGRRDKMSFRPVLQVRRDATPQQLRSLAQRLLEFLVSHPKVQQPPRVRFISISPQSFDLEIFSYVLTPDFDEFLEIQEGLLLRMLEIVAEEGAALAIPIQMSVQVRPGETKDKPGAELMS